MANALDAVLQYRAQEQQKQQAQGEQVAQAFQIFQQARQQAQANQLAQLQMKASLAEKGLVIDPTSPSGFKRDTSLMSPLEQLIQNGQAADANNKIIAGGGQGVNLFGAGGTQPIGGAVGQAISKTGESSIPTDNQGVIASQTLNVAGVPTDTKVEYPAADAAKELSKATQTTKEDFNTVLNMGDNFVSSLKASNIQSGGAGPVQGIIGNLAASVGAPDTGTIKAIKAVKRDSALAYARVLSGGSRGVATIFNNIVDTLPDSGFTPEQQGSVLAEMNLTAYSMLKAKKELGLTNSQINKMGVPALEGIISEQKAKMTKEETDSLYKAMGDRYKEISPRKSIDINGNVKEPKANPISKFIFGGKELNRPAGATHYSPSTNKFYDDKGNEVK